MNLIKEGLPTLGLELASYPHSCTGEFTQLNSYEFYYPYSAFGVVKHTTLQERASERNMYVHPVPHPPTQLISPPLPAPPLSCQLCQF